MAASDFLKTYRDGGYKGTGDGKKEGMDSGEPNSTTRIITLTDDEQKMFEQANPGDDLACEVHGKLDGNKLNVMSIGPMGGGESVQDDEKGMAGQVAQRVMPGIGM